MEHTEDENQWVFEGEGYITEDGVTLDADRVEEIMKPEQGVRYIGDVKDTSFIPIGFSEGKNKSDPRSKVEFGDESVFKKSLKRIVHTIDKIESAIFRFIGKKFND